MKSKVELLESKCKSASEKSQGDSARIVILERGLKDKEEALKAVTR